MRESGTFTEDLTPKAMAPLPTEYTLVSPGVATTAPIYSDATYSMG